MTKLDDVFVSSINDDMSPIRKHQHRHNVNSRYEFIKTLGKGNYGKVKLARHRETGQLVAVKAIRKEKVKDSTDMRHIRREIEIMSSIKHQHIIQIYEVFENEDKIVIVMEYAAGGELYDYLTSKPNSSDEEAKFFFRQIVSAIRYCHNMGIVHRDIKLENILLDENRCIKIADFGLANSFSSDKFLKTFCGSPLYASPEIVCGVPYKGPEVDSWSLGVLLYTLVYGTMPFEGKNYSTLTKQITSGMFEKPRRHSGAHELICWLLKVDPVERATLHDVAAHQWMAPFSEEKAASYASSPVEKTDPISNESETISKRTNQPTNQKANIALNSTPKNILKHTISLKEKPHSEPATPSTEEALAEKLAAVCRLSERSSLVLKSLRLGEKHKLIRSKRDRESGYYSSPERARHVLRETSSVSDPTLFNTSERSRPSLSNHQVIIERSSWPSTTSSSSTLQGACALGRCSLKQRFASTSSDDGCVGNQIRTESMCSDSSALSSDSFDICTCEYSNPPHFTPTRLTNTAKRNTPRRPVSLSLPSDASSSPMRNDSKKHSTGSLTPKSEMLDRELERILAPSGRRKRRQTASYAEPSVTNRLSTFDSKLPYENASNIDSCAKIGLAKV